MLQHQIFGKLMQAVGKKCAVGNDLTSQKEPSATSIENTTGDLCSLSVIAS